MTQLAEQTYTAREYRALERAAEHRNELVDGRICPKPGGSIAHSSIVGNLVFEIGTRLRGGSCTVLASAMRIKVSRTEMYAYPDVVALCEPPELEDAHLDTLLNPAVIFEVYSDETEAFDRGEKFAQYRRSETLREYILVSQHEVRVELYRRESDRWRFSEITDREGVLDIATLGCEVPVAEIYGEVDLPPSRARRG